MEIDNLDGLNCDHIYGGDFGIADYTSPNDDRYQLYMIDIVFDLPKL